MRILTDLSYSVNSHKTRVITFIRTDYLSTAIIRWVHFLLDPV